MKDQYLYRRAEAELRMGQRAAVPEAMKAHYELAARYLDQFYQPEPDMAWRSAIAE